MKLKKILGVRDINDVDLVLSYILESNASTEDVDARRRGC